MPTIEIRVRSGEKSPGDLLSTVTDKTFEFLMNGTKDSVRVSTYFDRDWSRVEASYEELYVNDACTSRFKIVGVSPGSKTRWTVTLPDEMKEGEQLTLQVVRTPR